MAAEACECLVLYKVFCVLVTMFSENLRKKFLMKPQEHGSNSFDEGRLRGVEDAKNFSAVTEEDEEADKVSEAQSADTEVDDSIDLHEDETRVWLKRIGLLEYAQLPWSAWQQNKFAEEQIKHLRGNSGYITEDKEVTTKLVAEVFKLPNQQGAKLKKITDTIMKGEFGPPEGTRAYYMVRNADKMRSKHLFWYLDKVCLLAKTAYMSKEAFAPLWNAERGVRVDWASFLFERLQIAEIKDKRWSPSLTKLVPYLGAIFSHVLQVPVGPVITQLKEAKKRKLEYGSLAGPKMKAPNPITWATPECSDTAVQGGACKLLNLPFGSNVPQLGQKSKLFTFIPSKLGEKPDEQKPFSSVYKPMQSQSWGNFNLQSVFTAHETINSLAELGRFINNQEAMVVSLESQKVSSE